MAKASPKSNAKKTHYPIVDIGWLRHLVNTLPVMMWVSDLNGSRTFFNQTWLQYTGKSMEEEVGRGWTKRVHKEDIHKLLAAYKEAFEKRLPYKMEYRLKRYDGQYRWILSEGTPTYTPDGIFTGFIGTCTEIHNKILLQDQLEAIVGERTKELKEANVSLERLNNSLEQFAYVASHDMQEPLRKIMTYSGILESKFGPQLSKEIIDYLYKINTNASRMQKLIHDLLNFSKLTKVEDDFQPVDLNGIVKNVLGDFDLFISQRNAKVGVSKLPTLICSPVSIRQLFYNLISNALKFSEDNVPPHIKITTRKVTKKDMPLNVTEQEKSRKFQLIEVSDNGIGFDQKYADKIFNVFQRLNTTQTYTGSGIGLSIVKKIIENHKGHISVTSQIGKGTIFRILLPITS